MSAAATDSACASRPHPTASPHAERYLLALAGRRLWLPRRLTPGRLTVRHVSVDFRCFIFTLTLDSPRLGRLVEQVIAFEEVVR